MMDDAIKCRLCLETIRGLTHDTGHVLRIVDPVRDVGMETWHACHGTALGRTLDEAARTLIEWNTRRVIAGHRPFVIVRGPPGRPRVKPGTPVRWHNGHWQWRHPLNGWTRA